MAVTTALDYASPSTPKTSYRRLGRVVGVISFCISMYVAKEAIEGAFWITHYPSWSCGFGYGVLQRQLWDLSTFQVIAAAAWPACVMFDAGIFFARVGVLVGALTWIGAYVVTV